MSDQPKPTGEWTVEKLVFWSRQMICDEHNAALDAERELKEAFRQKAREWQSCSFEHAAGTIKQLVDALTKISNGFTPADTIAKVALAKVGKQ